MKFKEFLKLSEEDRGLLGFGKHSSIRKPSDGQPFSRYTNSVSGQEPRGNSGGMGQMFMKKMKKKMKKK